MPVSHASWGTRMCPTVTVPKKRTIESARVKNKKLEYPFKKKVKYISNQIAGHPKSSERCGHGTFWFCEKLIHKK